LPAIQTPRYFSQTEVTPSQASQLLQKAAPTFFCAVHKRFAKLWKTNSGTSQSATYSRRKSLFCHSFDLSPRTVEPAVGNVGVAGWKPFIPWLSGLWLFFDQGLFHSLPTLLSTCLKTQVYDKNMSVQPVDKSVIKLWKDSRRGRNYWPGAIPLIPSFASGLHRPGPRSSKKLIKSR